MFFCIFSPRAFAQEILNSERFGTIKLFRGTAPLEQVALFFTGEDGWTETTTKLAKALTTKNIFLVGINTAEYLKRVREDDDDCAYLAGEIERLSQSAQSGAGLKTFVEPALVGVEAGAALAYAILSESPEPFKGALAIDFCPQLSLNKPLCEGAQLHSSLKPGNILSLAPPDELEPPLFVLASKPACIETEPFVSRLPSGAFVKVSGTALEIAVQEKLVRLFEEPGRVLSVGEELSDLPLVELSGKGPLKDSFAVFFSGDGGWASIDRSIAGYLVDRGVTVIGVDSLRYYWSSRKPEEAAADLARVIDYYSDKLKLSKVVLVGFSFGAEILPFLVHDLPSEIEAKVKLLALLSPASGADFVIHISGWIGYDDTSDNVPILPVVKKLKNLEVLCIWGSEEGPELCGELGGVTNVKWNSEVLPGAHHFNGDYDAVGALIMKRLP